MLKAGTGISPRAWPGRCFTSREGGGGGAVFATRTDPPPGSLGHEYAQMLGETDDPGDPGDDERDDKRDDGAWVTPLDSPDW